MSALDDFRVKSYHLLIQLNAATSAMKTMVSAKEIAGLNRDTAALRHHDAFEAWSLFLNLSLHKDDTPIQPQHKKEHLDRRLGSIRKNNSESHATLNFLEPVKGAQGVAGKTPDTPRIA